MNLRHTNPTASGRRDQLTNAVAETRSQASSATRRARWWVIVICAIGILPRLTGHTAESYSTVVSKHLALESGVAVNASTTDENPAIADLKRAVRDEVATLPQGTQAALPPKTSQSTAVPATVLALGALLTFGTVGYLFKRRFDSMLSASDLAEGRAKLLLADDPSLAAFFNELRDGMNLSERTTASPTNPSSGATWRSRCCPKGWRPTPSGWSGSSGRRGRSPRSTTRAS
jgi:hypothetical protein